MTVFELPNATGPTLFVDPENGAPLLVLRDSTFEECWTLPTGAYELTARETVIEEIVEVLRLTDGLTKKARSTFEQLLDDLPR